MCHAYHAFINHINDDNFFIQNNMTRFCFYINACASKTDAYKIITKPMVNTTCTISTFYTTYRFSVQLAGKRYNVAWYPLETFIQRIG